MHTRLIRLCTCLQLPPLLHTVPAMPAFPAPSPPLPACLPALQLPHTCLPPSTPALPHHTHLLPPHPFLQTPPLPGNDNNNSSSWQHGSMAAAALYSQQPGRQAAHTLHTAHCTPPAPAPACPHTWAGMVMKHVKGNHCASSFLSSPLMSDR